MSVKNTTSAEVYLVNLETLEKLSIMYIPRQLEWEAPSNWVAIPTIGRNNPFYHYTGAEDKLSFELDWFAYDEDRVLAINAATKVKSWARNNGYRSRPPRIQLIWGKLFQNHVFIIEDASYTLSDFQQNKQMMPAQIRQQLVLNKVTEDNELRDEIDENFTPPKPPPSFPV